MKRAGSVLCPVIVGRDDVLELFDHLIAETAQGRGHALFLAAPAGLGKTRLVRAVARKAAAAGMRADGGSLAPQDRHVPLQSIRDMASGMRGNESFGTLSADLLAFDGQHDGDALGSRRLLVRGIADRILAEMDQPTLLIFDDLHWADEMSLEVIGELARFCADKPLLLLGGYRPDEFPPDSIHREWRSRILQQRHAQEVRLRPLSLDETAIATTLILGSELPAPREVAEAVHERTNGIPLHIEELLGALDEDARTDGQRIREAHVPDTIEDAVLARLARLSDDARQLARAGAVIGRCFSPDVLAGVMNRPLVELEGSIQELVDAAILHPFDYIDAGYYDFRHQLLRDAVYATVPPSQLRRYHAQVAEFGMSLEGAHLIHASRHFERAGLHGQAYRASLKAAQEASRISARHEAFELFRRAIDNKPRDLPAGEQAELFERYADAAAAIEHNEESLEAARRARELYLAAERPLDAAGTLLSLSVLAARNGAPRTEVRAYLERAVAELDALPEGPDRTHLRAYLFSAQADDDLLRHNLGEARGAAEAAHAIGESLGDRELVLETDLTLARIDIVAGRTADGLRDGMRAAREARDAGYEAVGVTGYRNMAILAARVMDTPTAELALGEGLRYADAIEQSHCRQMMATTAAILDWAGGRWDEADERARQELVDRGCRRGVTGSLDVIGLVALGRGQLVDARRWLEDSLASGRTIGEVQYILTPLWGLAEVDLQAGDVDGAIARCADGLAVALASGERALLIPFVVTGVRSFLAARRPDDAERWLGQVRDHLAGWEVIAAPALDQADGLVRLAGGSVSAARELLERAARGWEERGRAWESAWARLDVAQCLLRANRYGEAASLLATVRATAEGLESEPLIRRADELVLVGRGRGSVEEPWRPLTAREFAVARLIAEGLTNAEIAEQLDIAPKTASSHVEHILAKLAVARRAEIAAWTATIGRAPQPVPELARGGGADRPTAHTRR